MKSHINVFLILLIYTFILSSCGSGLNTVSIDSDKPIKFKNYSFHSPIGDDWEYQPNEEIQSVMFYRQSDDVMQYVTGDTRNTFIDVYRNYTTMPTKNIDRQEFANGYMDNEFQIMVANAGQTPYGVPTLISKDTVIISEKILCRMNYKYTRQLGQCHFYIYLPNRFEDTGIFYLFLIAEFGGKSLLSSGYDFDQINNVLATFICDED